MLGIASAGCGLTSCLSCLAWNICCSVAGCFCPQNAKVAKITYLLIFMLSAVLGIVLRYYASEALSGWVNSISLCSDSKCFGMQANFRISASVLAFFLIMTILTAIVPVLHLGLWLLKVCLYILLLGLSLLISNDFFDVYSQISRYGSILFIIIQVMLFVDLAHNIHDYLVKRMTDRDKEMEAAGWQPGIFSNCWKILYTFLSFVSFGGSITALGLLFKYFGDCGLMQFFLSETLIIGLIFIIASVCSNGGVLTPCLVFAYNTYLVYGALTNNPDETCNIFAASERQNQASIITGLVIAILSITWAAFSSAGNFQKTITASAQGQTSSNSATATTAVHKPVATTDVELATPKPGVEMGADKAGKAADYETSAADSGSDASNTSRTSSSTTTATSAAKDEVEKHPWAFHLTMTFAGLYLAMLLTNWGNADVTTGNPELSEASMWVRIVSQWLIYVFYAWTLVAPFCCTSRDFSR